MFPVGGLGTRFLPATKAMPKEMLPVVDKPLIQYAVEEALAAGIEEIIFVTGRGKTAIEDFFDHSFELRQVLGERGKDAELRAIDIPVLEPGRVAYTRQQDPMGLGHAVWCARELVGEEPFAILLADDLVMAENPCLNQMVAVFNDTGGNVVAVEEYPENIPIGTASEVESDDGRLAAVNGMVEKPDPEDAPSVVSSGGTSCCRRFRLSGRKEEGAGGGIQLTDSMAQMIGEAPFHGLRFEGKRFDCGDKVVLEANVAFALARLDLRDHVQEVIDRYAAGPNR